MNHWKAIKWQKLDLCVCYAWIITMEIECCDHILTGADNGGVTKVTAAQDYLCNKILTINPCPWDTLFVWENNWERN
jgi:hypothetical protein